MTWLKTRLFDPQHPYHFGSVLLVGWALAALNIFPTVMFPKHPAVGFGQIFILGGPVGAHLYSLRALLPLRNGEIRANMLAALLTLSYVPAVIICLFLFRWVQAIILPLAGPMMAILSFGILLPGLSPFIAYALNANLVRPAESHWRFGLAIGLFTLGWVISAISVEVISSI